MGLTDGWEFAKILNVSSKIPDFLNWDLETLKQLLAEMAKRRLSWVFLLVNNNNCVV